MSGCVTTLNNSGFNIGDLIAIRGYGIPSCKEGSYYVKELTSNTIMLDSLYPHHCVGLPGWYVRWYYRWFK